jgi:hypothetical protein
MLMRTIFVLLLLAQALFSPVTQARAEGLQGPIYGGGQFGCTTWNETYSGDAHAWARYGEWAAGYVSAATRAKGLAHTNNTVMFGFITSYCKAHPNDTIATASEKFVATLPASSASNPHP